MCLYPLCGLVHLEDAGATVTQISVSFMASR